MFPHCEQRITKHVLFLKLYSLVEPAVNVTHGFQDSFPLAEAATMQSLTFVSVMYPFKRLNRLQREF